MKIFLRDYGNRHIFKKTQLSPVRYRYAGDELFIVKIGKLSEVGFDTQFIRTRKISPSLKILAFSAICARTAGILFRFCSVS